MGAVANENQPVPIRQRQRVRIIPCRAELVGAGVVGQHRFGSRPEPQRASFRPFQTPPLLGAAGSLVAVWPANYTGPAYWLQPQCKHASNAQIRLFEEHKRDARLLLWSASALALAIVTAVERSDGRTGASLRWIAAGAALVTLGLVVITGHAGAKAVWAP